MSVGLLNRKSEQIPFSLIKRFTKQLTAITQNLSVSKEEVGMETPFIRRPEIDKLNNEDN